MEHGKEIKPGFYTYTEEERGAAAAEVEQKRAEILDELRISKCFTVSILDDEGGVLHSTFIIGVGGDGGNHEPPTFLSYAILKTVHDLASVLEVDMDQVLSMLQQMVRNGVGEEWT